MARTNVTVICERFRARLRNLTLQIGAARMAALGLLTLATMLAVDWAVHIQWGWRLIPLAAFLAGEAALAYWTILKPLQHRWSDPEVLGYIDSTAKPGENMLLDLYELQSGEEIQERQNPAGEKLATEALEGLEVLVAKSQVETGLNQHYPKRWTIAGAAAAGVFVVAAILLPEYAAIGLTRFFNPFSSARWPHRTTITLDEPQTGWKIPQGEAFSLSAAVSGLEVPTHVTLNYLSADLGFWMEEKLPVNDGKIRYTFPQVNDALQFQLRGGDYATDRYTVQLTFRPRLNKITARYEYPPYAGLPSRSVDSGQLSGLEGTKITLQFTASLPLKRAVFLLDGKPEDLSLSSPTTFSKTLLLEKDGRYSVQLFDVDGFRELTAESYEIRVTPDEPPSVELLAPGRDMDATARASVPVSFRARDDFGLKKVEFLYSIDGGKAEPLSDRITGPLAVRDKDFATHFTWSLAQSKWPDSDRITVEYFARVTDVNPTGRGVVESPRRKINLLKPSVYREQLFQEAGALLNEALLAERNQREAYFAAQKWIGGTASGKEDDPLWTEITQKQDGAIRAARAMEKHLKDLGEQYEMNRIAFEFMSGRLADAGQNLHAVLNRHHPAIEKALTDARPRSATEAAPAALQKTRTDALKSIHETAEGQKLATLLFQRILNQLYDWRDLQGAAVMSLRIAERQEEVSAITGQIAPKYIGKNILDLADEDQSKLKAVGTQEKALYDAESTLETQLKILYTKSEAEQRKSFEPLRRAFADLRSKRVNDNLSRASLAIENNQAGDILELQKNAIAAVRSVTTGLESAGQVVEKLPPLTLAMPVRKTDPDKAEIASKKTEGSSEEPASIDVSPTPAMRTDALASDALTAALLDSADLLELALKRARYLSANMGSAEMPRFVALKLGMLDERHAQALASLAKAQDEAAKDKNETVRQHLAAMQNELAPLKGVIAARDIGPRLQQILADAIETCRDLTQYRARQKAIVELKDEHNRQGGVDAFKRPYILREKDLESAVEMIAAFDNARLKTRDAARKVQRFSKDAPRAESPAVKLEAGNRERASETVSNSARDKDSITKALGQMTAVVKPAVSAKCNDVLGADWAKSAAGIREGGKDAALGEDLAQLSEKMLAAIDGLRDLADARGDVPPPPEDETKPKELPPQAVAQMTQEEFEKTQSPEALSERLQKSASLPAAVRESLTRSLKNPMPAKYKPLLTAFVNSCLEAGEVKKADGAKPKEDAK